MNTLLITAAAWTPAMSIVLPLSMVVAPLHIRRRHDRKAARLTALECLTDRSWRREQLRQIWERHDFQTAVAGAPDERLARQVHATLTAPRSAPGVDIISTWWTTPLTPACRIPGATLIGAAA